MPDVNKIKDYFNFWRLLDRTRTATNSSVLLIFSIFVKNLILCSSRIVIHSSHGIINLLNSVVGQLVQYLFQTLKLGICIKKNRDAKVMISAFVVLGYQDMKSYFEMRRLMTYDVYEDFIHAITAVYWYHLKFKFMIVAVCAILCRHR